MRVPEIPTDAISTMDLRSPLSTMGGRQTLEAIYPYVVPKSWVDYAIPNALVTWQFSDDVRLIMVREYEGCVCNLRPEDLAELGETAEDIYDIATGNLVRSYERGDFELGLPTLVDGIKIGGARGGWKAPAGALLLGTLYHAMREHFDVEEFAAVVVNQEVLLAFPTDDRTLASRSLRTAIDEEFQAHRKPVSRSWLRLDGGWPSEHPMSGSFDIELPD